MDSSKVVILDIRVPSLPAATLDGHMQCVNALAWAPPAPTDAFSSLMAAYGFEKKPKAPAGAPSSAVVQQLLT